MEERPKIRGRGPEAGASILRGSLTRRGRSSHHRTNCLTTEGGFQIENLQLETSRSSRRRGRGGAFVGSRVGRGLTRPGEPAGVGAWRGLGRPQETVAGQAEQSRGTLALRMGSRAAQGSLLPACPSPADLPSLGSTHSPQPVVAVLPLPSLLSVQLARPPPPRALLPACLPVTLRVTSHFPCGDHQGRRLAQSLNCTLNLSIIPRDLIINPSQ